jgi:hypothetical protein
MKDKPDYSRRRFLTHCLTGAAVAGTAAVPAQALNRFSKQASKYQNQPNGDERCGRCRYFQAPGSCAVVTGNISPRGWCKWFRGQKGGAM